MNINKYEDTICNTGWVVLGALLIWLWLSTPAEASFLGAPAAEAVAAPDPGGCGDD